MNELEFALIVDRRPMTLEQVGALADSLLIALRDDHPDVRERAARALLQVVVHSMERSRPVARPAAVVAAMADSLGIPFEIGEPKVQTAF